MTDYLLCVLIILLARAVDGIVYYGTMPTAERRREYSRYLNMAAFSLVLGNGLIFGGVLYGALRFLMWATSSVLN